VVTGVVFAKRKRIRFPVVADIAGPSVLVGQILGRWGNFVNVEAFGGETDLPWRMGVLKSMDGGETFYSEMYVHPTFLYESLWNLVGLILITSLYKKKKFHGQMFIMYMTWYGFGRMLIEGLRSDSLYIGDMRVSQFVGAVTFILGVILMIVNLRRVKSKGKSEQPYTAVYAAAAASADAAEQSEAAAEELQSAEHGKTNENNTEKEN